MPATHRPPGTPTKTERARADRARRGNRHEQGYTNRWHRLRTRYLVEHPLCVHCHALGRAVPATVVDHIKPHRRDPLLMWDETNWQALCRPCHDGWKRRLENAAHRAQTRSGARLLADRGRQPWGRR